MSNRKLLNRWLKLSSQLGCSGRVFLRSARVSYAADVIVIILICLEELPVQ